VPAKRIQMEDSVKPNWNSLIHSAQLFNVGSISEESGENLESVENSLTSWTSTLMSSSSSTLSKLTTVHLIMGRLLSSLEEYKGGESESSNFTLSSDAEEEYGNSLRVMSAFVNFLKQAQ